MGRITQKPKDSKLNITLDAAAKERLQEIAIEQDISVSHLIRMWISQHDSEMEAGHGRK